MATKPKATTKSNELTAAAAEKPALKIIDTANVEDAPVAETSVVRKPQFIERVVARSEMRKRHVKPSVEAALTVIAEAIAAGEELVLPPLGKIKVVKGKEFPNGTAYTLKLRIPNTPQKSEALVAVNAEDGLAAGGE